MEELLCLEGIVKEFSVRRGFFRRPRGSFRAVDGVSFALRRGEALGLVGESGCGKSTLGRLCLRLIEPTQGCVKFQGRDLRQMEREELRLFRKRAQMVFQDPYASLNPRLTVADNVGEALLVHRLVRSRKELQDRLERVLEQVGLTSAALAGYPHQFSGGQQQRICIARAIALEPFLLVCDEVVSALDVAVRAQVLNLLADLKEQLSLSYLFISHDLSVVRYLCDRVAVLYMGRIVEVADTEELFTNPKHPYTRALLAAVPKEHPREVKAGLVLSGESRLGPSSGCPFRLRCPLAEERCKEEPPLQTLGTHQWSCIHP